MGGVPSKKQVDVESLPRIYPEEDYVIRTRSPMPDTWTMNIMRGKREDELRLESYPLARRKCYDYVKVLEQCNKDNGKFWTIFNCQEENNAMGSCFNHELKVEMDRRRRDMARHPEWWWRDLYDENGEVGDQEDWDGSWFASMEIKKILGINWRKSKQTVESQ